MHTYPERTRLLTAEQRRLVQRMAAREGRPVGAVIPDVVDAYVGQQTRSREEALASLLALDAPVDGWDTMKAEIIAGATAGAP